MKFKTLIVMIIFAAILSNCNRKTNSTDTGLPEKLDIDENKKAAVSFTLVKSASIRFVAYPHISVSHWDDRLIVFGEKHDTNGKKAWVVHQYTKNLEFIGEKFFHFGQGPGDTGAYNVATITKDNILRSENTNQRVSVFSKNLDLQDSIKCKSLGGAFTIFNDGKLYIRNVLEQNGDQERRSFVLVSFPGLKKIPLFTTEYYSTRIMHGGNPAKALFGGNRELSWFCSADAAYIFLNSNYRILKLDFSGNKIKDVLVNVNEIKTDLDQEAAFFEESGFKILKKSFTLCRTVNPIATTIPLGKGFIAVRRTNQYMPACDGTNEGDYFSYDLNYLGKVNVPCFYGILSLRFGRNCVYLGYSHGFIYLLKEEEEELLIEKWKVSE